MDSSTATAQQVLQELGVEFTTRSDGLLEVPGDLKLQGKGLTRLPDLSQVVVLGSFSCINNELTSLKGAPQYVGKDFWCTNNQIETLEHAPQHIGDNLYCYNNRLMTLQGAPAELGGGLYCKDNNLSSLAGAPSKLTVLWCHDNPLTSLEGAPKEFKVISTSDFGDFSSWDEMFEKAVDWYFHM